MKHAITLVLLISLGLSTDAQDFYQQRRRFAAISIGVNGAVGGIGAIINKKKEEKAFRVFLKGFGQGCLGGSFQVLGKELTYQINTRENLTYAWPARISNSIGNSIVQNAASNINFWERWHFNLGLLRLDYHIKEKHFQARIFPSALYGLLFTAPQGKFNLKRSLQTGIFIYENDGLVQALGGASIGVGAISSIAVDQNVTGRDYYSLMAHEVFHIIQYDNLVWINPAFNRMDNNFKESSKFYQKASKYIYLDFNGMTFWALYRSQINRAWECRFIEREADLYSRRRNWPDCN